MQQICLNNRGHGEDVAVKDAVALEERGANGRSTGMQHVNRCGNAVALEPEIG